jgi:enamine deaminase RidA (YjgF/YER057c/UK114 family)
VTRAHASSGSPYEAAIGFSRAVRVGRRVLVSGTAPVEDDGSSTAGGAAEQAERCCVLIDRALRDLGASAADVVRTRMFLTDAADAEAVGRVHARWFGQARPAATMVVAASLLRPEWLVEIEAEAEAEAGA